MTRLKNITLTALFLGLGIVLPMFIGQIPQIGSMLLPMHIPVFLCAFICGWKYSVPMAFILPLIRSILFSRPNMYPEAIAIAFELSSYAFVAGFIYNRSKGKNIKTVYGCLLTAMVTGRIIRGIVQLVLLRIIGAPFTFNSFLIGIIVAGIPGIIFQLIIIPIIITILKSEIKSL